MKLYSERFKNVDLCNIPTYDEILTVRNGFTETELSNSIRALQSIQWGFIKVVETPKVEAPKVEAPKVEAPKVEELPIKEQDKTKPKLKPMQTVSAPKETIESAMTMNDVDAILGSKKTSKPRKSRK